MAPAAISAWAWSRARSRTATRSCLPTSAYSVNPGLYNTLPYDPFKDFVAICELAVSPHVFAVKPDLGASTMKEFVALAKKNPGQVQRVDAADRHHAAASGRSAQAARRAAEDGDDRVSGWRRCAQGAAERDRAALVGRARARASADQGRQRQGAGSHRHDALARSAGDSDHAGSGLSGFRVRDLHGNDGAGEGRRPRSSPGSKRSRSTSSTSRR